MSVTLKERINDDVKAALRAGDKRRLGALRLILAAIKQREVDERITLDDAQVISVLDKMIRQRKESIEMYQKGGRQDLVNQESFELQLLQGYLPTPLADAEIDALVKRAITEAGAVSIKDMGKVMAILKPQLQGRADMSAVSGLVKQHLSS
jgi:uncharacterized protein YqeY